MNNILVPIDGSEVALRALAHALQSTANQPGAQVQLLNVQAPLLHPWPGNLVSPDIIDAELRTQGENTLATAQSVALAADRSCPTHVRIGHAAQVIADFARLHGCDSIVMGTRGMGAVKDLVLGSVAHKVVHLASVPVTLVK